MLYLYGDMAANVIRRRVFDMTSGWNGKPAAGEHVFVVTHRPPTDWEYAYTTPFTFVGGVEKAISAAKEFAGDRVVDVAAGQIGGQAPRLGLIEQVVVNQVPVVFGSGRPFFATGGLAEPLWPENPTTIVRGDRVTPPGLRRQPLRPAVFSVPARRPARDRSASSAARPSREMWRAASSVIAQRLWLTTSTLCPSGSRTNAP